MKEIVKLSTASRFFVKQYLLIIEIIVDVPYFFHILVLKILFGNGSFL